MAYRYETNPGIFQHWNRVSAQAGCRWKAYLYKRSSDRNGYINGYFLEVYSPDFTPFGAGWRIIRLKYGLYALSSVVPGISPLHEFQIAMALVQPAAISHWSALNYHGMTEQVPQRVFVLTSAHILPGLRGRNIPHPQRGYPVGRTLYQFVQIKPDHFFGITEIWVNESKVKVTDAERTCLDCLMFPEYAGGFYEVLSIFKRNISRLDIEKMIQYALRLDAATIKRLGWILEQQGIDLSKLELLQKTSIKGYRLLDKTGLRKGAYNSRWMIQENLAGR
ncbi:MAG TPA: type IV toxin-antitoxin system AbiEi family antitoxin [Gammaproteobacteria bacterium]|nr:type IV toxin-antitoxin system AbiEi family antitoxin [Gammaproteobacteria bacterium]